MINIVLLILTLICAGCATGGVGSPGVENQKGEPSRVMGLAVLELHDQPAGLNCTASFLTANVLLTSASCLQFETKQGDLGTAQSVETGEFLPIDTIWSLSSPNEPGDIGLVRLSQPPAVVSVFQIKEHRSTAPTDTRFGGTGCEPGVRSAHTSEVQLPPQTRGICPQGSGGVIFDTHRRQIHAMHVGIHSNGDDQYTELPFYAQQIAQATADLIGAPTGNVPSDMDNAQDPCRESNLYNDGICHQECALADPDCSVSETPPCQAANDYLDGQCPANCETDPDCRREQPSENVDLCEQQGLYGDGRCHSCPQIDPDCEANGTADFCEDQNLYNDGTCNRCPRPDPDCDTNQTQNPPSEQSGDVCAMLGAYGDGKCDSRCPRRDPDCDTPDQTSNQPPGHQDSMNQPQPASESNSNGSSGNDLCAALNWYNDGECDTVCANPDPDCDQTPPNSAQQMGTGTPTGSMNSANENTEDECAIHEWYGDGECDTFCANPDPDCNTSTHGNAAQNNGNESNQQTQGSDLCEALGWYNDGECDTVCASPDPDC